MGNVFQRSGGGSPTASSTPTVPVKPDHEAHVQFAREFVVELVETVPKKSSEKAALAKLVDKEDIVSLKSEGSFQSVNSVPENTSLPDLLQPESVYKKQTDTDTDTTEYESAAETDPIDTISPIENLIAEDIITGFHEALDKKELPSESQKQSSDNSVSQTTEPSPLSEVYEDVGDTVVRSESDNEVKPLDISGLCLFVSNLCLDSPKRSEDSEPAEDHVGSLNSSSGIVVNNSVVTEQSFSSVGDSTFLVEDKCSKINESLGDSDQVKETFQVDPANASSLIPGNTSVSSAIILDPNLLDSTNSETEFIKQESGNNFQVTPEATPVSPGILPDESSVIQQPQVSPETVFDELSAGLPVVLPAKFSEVKQTDISSGNTPIVTLAEIKQTEVPSENNLDVALKNFEELKIKSPEESKNILDVSPKFTEVLIKSAGELCKGTEVSQITEESEEISPTKSVEIPTGEIINVTTDTPEKLSVEPEGALQENTSEVKSNEISELIDSLVTQTELHSKEIHEELSVKPLETLSEKALETTPTKSPEIISKNLELPEKQFEILETVGGSTKVSEDHIPVTEVTCQPKLTEAFPIELEVTAVESTEILPKTPFVEPLTLTESTEVLPVEQVEEPAKTQLVEKPVETTAEVETNVLAVTVKPEQPVALENIPAQKLKIQEAETESSKAKSLREWTSEIDICCSESIPVEETPSVASVTNSIEEKLLESKHFSTSFEVLSIDKEVPTELVEEKIQVESTDSARESSEKSSSVKSLNLSAEVGAGDFKLQQSEKEATVLTELFEICNRQQKDLDLGDEKFVDGREFFDPPSISTSLNETIVVRNSQPELSETVKSEKYGDFDDSITEEAEKIYQEILNASSHLNECSVNSSDGTTQQTSKMADVRGSSNSATTIVDDGLNPFATQSSLRRSPPPSAKHSPRSNSQGPSPADSPRLRSKLSSVNQARENSLSRDGIGDASRSMSGKNSPDCRVSNKVSSLEGSPKNSIISSEINQSEAGPEIADEAHVQGSDVFKDPTAFDFLNSVGNSNVITDLRKESLYVKFDPLVGGARTIEQSVPLPQAYEAKSNNNCPSANSSPHESFSNNVTPPRNVAISVVDKLISLSPSPRKQQVETPVKQVTTPVREVSQNYSDNSSMVEELYLLREILAKQDEKHREEVLLQQKKFEHLQAQLKEYEDREARLNKKVAEKAQGQKQMSIIMEEYEKTISRLVAEKEQERQAHELDRASLVKERDTAMGHLANIEIAFSDLHKKYERSKTVIEGFKKNEELLRSSLAEYESTIRKQEQKYDVLKSHALTQLENANQELESVRRSQQAEAAKLKAMLKKSEVKTSSLEEMLEQKVKENQELASICDELISKVGSSE